MSNKIHLQTIIPEELSGKRLDQALARLFPQYSRSRIQQWIKAKQVWVDEHTKKPKEKVFGHETIRISTELVPLEPNWEPQAMSLCLIHEDDDLLIVDKPAGLVVHPAAGNPDCTLVNGLLHHCPALVTLPRAGLIHRLDKETTGLLIVAKTIEAHTYLVNALQERLIKREYIGLVHGEVIAGDTIDAPMGRHPAQRIKMAVVPDGKPAVTHYRVRTRYQNMTLLDIRLETGRTHQIRVHLAHIGYPIVGDPLYATRFHTPFFKRQALHATRLTFVHPRTQESCSFHSPLPEDFQQLLTQIGAHTNRR